MDVQHKIGETPYVGIDYSLGQSNVDRKTGIHYGVISANSCDPEAVNDLITQGTDVAFLEAKKQCLETAMERVHHWFNEHAFVRDGSEDQKRERFKEMLQVALDDCVSRYTAEKISEDVTESWGWTTHREEIQKEVEAAVENHFGDGYEGNSDNGLNDYVYERDGYVLTGCLQHDVFVLRSDYYTYAQFCSPCVPGAGNLDHAFDAHVEGAPRTYCLQHDWFENSKAPYRVWRVTDGVEILRHEDHYACPNCKGSGRDTAQRVADVRGCPVADVDTSHFEGFDPETMTFQCFRCSGSGKVAETNFVDGSVDPNFKSDHGSTSS